MSNSPNHLTPPFSENQSVAPGINSPNLGALGLARSPQAGGDRASGSVFGLVSNHISRRDHPREIYARCLCYSGGIKLKRHALSAVHPPLACRGIIKGFSKGSRRRMCERLMSLDWDLLMPTIGGINYGAFITLTYPDNFSDDREKWKRDLEVLTKRLDRNYPNTRFKWKLELKKRKSGENKGKLAPHFHLLAYNENGLNLVEFRIWLSQAWYEVVGSTDIKHLSAGTQVKPLYGTVAKLMNYCAKYLGKDFETDFETGRCWGEHGDMPCGEIYSFDIDYIEFCRRVRRWGKSSPYLSTRKCPNGMMIFGQVAQLTIGLRVDGLSPPDKQYRELVTKRTIANLKARMSVVKKRKAENLQIVQKFNDDWAYRRELFNRR